MPLLDYFLINTAKNWLTILAIFGLLGLLIAALFKKNGKASDTHEEENGGVTNE